MCIPPSTCCSTPTTPAFLPCPTRHCPATQYPYAQDEEAFALLKQRGFDPAAAAQLLEMLKSPAGAHLRLAEVGEWDLVLYAVRSLLLRLLRRRLLRRRLQRQLLRWLLLLLRRLLRLMMV